MKDLEKDEMIDVLKKTPDGVLALSDGAQPYCIPFGFVYVRGEVYLSMFATGRKWELLQKNPRACFNVYCWNDGRTEWRSVVIDGDIEQVHDLDSIEAVVKANIEKMGLDPVGYLPKRMEYYKKNLDNPKALKTFRIKTRSMGGRTMHTLLGS
jgi:nitroimidazol reductase NimA-like FMN-containing flavoprotein (pyridoxamine 5'-phosphate oxidase superfamily)